MAKAGTVTFQALLEHGGPSFMPTQVVAVPPLALASLGGKSTKRVVRFLNGHPVRLGLLPQTGGGRFLMINRSCAAPLECSRASTSYSAWAPTLPPTM